MCLPISGVSTPESSGMPVLWILSPRLSGRAGLDMRVPMLRPGSVEAAPPANNLQRARRALSCDCCAWVVLALVPFFSRNLVVAGPNTLPHPGSVCGGCLQWQSVQFRVRGYDGTAVCPMTLCGLTSVAPDAKSCGALRLFWLL